MVFKRTISPRALLLSAIGGMVGSGWLLGPMNAAQLAGPAAVISWVLGGVLMLFIALTFAELSSTYPVTGGLVEFAQLSHGRFFSFTTGWAIWLASVAVAPIETTALLQYATNYIPGLFHSIDNKPVLTVIGYFVAVILLFFMCWLNWFGAKFFSKTSSGLVVIKLAVPFITLITLFFIGFHPQNFTGEAGFLPYGWQGMVTALPLGGVIFSFIGYGPAIQLAGEAKNPKVAVPLAIIGGLTTCIFLYALLQIAFVGVLTPSMLANGWAHLSFTGKYGPIAGILSVFGVTWLMLVIYADAIISPFGTGYIYTAATGRVTYALSRINFFPAWFMKLNNHHVPARAIGLNFVGGLILLLPFPSWQSLVGFLVSCFVISYIVGPIALAVLRHGASPSDQTRSFRLPCPKLICVIAFYIANLIIFWTGWETVSKLMFALFIGFIVLLLNLKRKDELSLKQSFKNSWWLIPYLVCLALISYLGTFGEGTKLIPFGLDFVIIAILTLSVFIAALRTAKMKKIEIPDHS